VHESAPRAEAGGGGGLSARVSRRGGALKRNYAYAQKKLPFSDKPVGGDNSVTGDANSSKFEGEDSVSEAIWEAGRARFEQESASSGNASSASD